MKPARRSVSAATQRSAARAEAKAAARRTPHRDKYAHKARRHGGGAA